MGKSQETFNKKEKEKKRLQKRKEKEEKRQQRKAENAKKGKTLEDMMAYVDEYGRISSTPPDASKKRVIKAEDIELGVPKREEENPFREGKITYFNEAKGYGFIKDLATQESVFFHVNGFLDKDLKMLDKVGFEVERSPRGLSAVRVKKA